MTPGRRLGPASAWPPFLLAALLLVGAVPAFAHPSWGIVADREGRVYFSDLETVWRLDKDGRLSVFRPRVEGVHVHELALAPDGGITGDALRYDPARITWHAGIWKRSPAGGETWLLAPTTAPPNGSGLAVDRVGNSYTTQWRGNDDRRTMLWRLTPGGRSELLDGDPKAAAGYRQVVVASVGGMAFAPDASLIFGDGARVRRLAPDGKVEDLYRGGAGANIRGLAVGVGGVVHAADMAGRALLAIRPGGKADIVYRSPQGWAPSGVTFAGGRLLLLEAEQDPAHRSNRVRVVEVVDSEGRVIAMPGAESADAAGAAGDGPGPSDRSGIALFAAFSLALAAALGLMLRSARRKRLAGRPLAGAAQIR